MGPRQSPVKCDIATYPVVTNVWVLWCVNTFNIDGGTFIEALNQYHPGFFGGSFIHLSLTLYPHCKGM